MLFSASKNIKTIIYFEYRENQRAKVHVYARKKVCASIVVRIVQDLKVKKGYFSARGLGAKRIIGGVSTICKEAETILKYNFGLISHVIITCAF